MRLRDACEEAMSTSRWLSDEVASQVPVHMQFDVLACAHRIESIFLYGILPGYETDFTASMLYRVRPPNGSVML